jgi:uncharacterized damage-inducible protein DinB
LALRPDLVVANPLDPAWLAPAGLEPLLRAHVTTTHERHLDMINLVRDLSPAALDWRPAVHSASLAGLVLHVVDVETYIARAAAGEEVEWAGENGSRMDESAAAQELVAALQAVDALLKGVLVGLTAERLAALAPGGARTIGEMLGEDLDHSSMHYGHMQLTRHLWEEAHPEFESEYTHWR